MENVSDFEATSTSVPVIKTPLVPPKYCLFTTNSCAELASREQRNSNAVSLAPVVEEYSARTSAPRATSA